MIDLLLLLARDLLHSFVVDYSNKLTMIRYRIIDLNHLQEI
jgi:hypothetical protein